MGITVGCKCGWQGDQDTLLRGPTDLQPERYCPNCAALFSKYPPSTAGEASAIAAHEYLWPPQKPLSD